MSLLQSFILILNLIVCAIQDCMLGIEIFIALKGVTCSSIRVPKQSKQNCQTNLRPGVDDES